jgi:hypothetical protein
MENNSKRRSQQTMDGKFGFGGDEQNGGGSSHHHHFHPPQGGSHPHHPQQQSSHPHHHPHSFRSPLAHSPPPVRRQASEAPAGSSGGADMSLTPHRQSEPPELPPRVDRSSKPMGGPPRGHSTPGSKSALVSWSSLLFFSPKNRVYSGRFLLF